MPISKPRYAGSEEWADIDPLPQDDGGPNALATIAYTEEYKDAMAYLRAVMAANEFSNRVLELTAHIISLNPAHYTVWLYRAKCLTAINADLHAEVTYLNGVSLRFIKNYQIWHHRQHIINLLDSPDGESDFLAQMLDKDAKNYHVWSYRQWLVKHFGLWDDHSEIEEVERFLRRDVRNNSAWNHRWFVVFGKVDEERQRRKKQQQEQQQQQESPSNKAGKQVEVEVTEEVWQREVEFAKDALRMAPQNESPWNYLRGLFRERGRPLSDLTDFAEEFAQVSWEEEGVDGKEVSGEAQPAKQIRSSHALDILADAYAEDGSRLADAERALDMLAERYDPIRANYWHWKKGLLGSGKAAAA